VIAGYRSNTGNRNHRDLPAEAIPSPGVPAR
jgi:hypothetical protein